MRVLLTLTLAVALSGCGMLYKQPVQQGNLLEDDQVDALKEILPVVPDHMRLPDGDGLELVRFIGDRRVIFPLRLITAYGSMENAVQALKAGAFDYLAKTVSLEQLRALVKSVFTLPQSGGAAVSATAPASGLLGDSPAMQQVRDMIDKLAKSLAPVWITGESGSGKERAARLIHENGQRGTHPFIAVNCGAIPENLMESEFFGYRKGSFTGAETAGRTPWR